MPKNGKRLYIQEVSVRDGFQMEPIFIPTDRKIEFINGLSRTGLAKIEVTSFTSPKAIPALADAEAVMCRIERVPGVEYAALVPNLRGCERALSCGVDEINLVMSASESHNMANLRMTPQQSLEQFAQIAAEVNGRVRLNASLSTTFGCPFDGEIPLSRVLEVVARFVDMGMDGVTLCDTTGMANPAQVARVCEAVRQRWPNMVFTAHFHNTRGMGLANVLAALQAGIDRFDASLGGLGGCPFAPGASGNVCTEDMVHMLEAMGYDTGADLEALLALARELPGIVQHEIPGQVVKAGPWTRRYPLPASRDRQGS
ncbi:hydroxymethylglutaryl-CoA lyase [Pusillimonas noertemannii]|uniref:hydroxymethylglutaryl-CoA lyase n=1 Tax=Pusillimonas noertemannii TaxID=305977 RepID=UPI000E308093|nr:hydroxymethylglutaryl-CoA lyase [Pusillimonas noertemannii]NYT70778.1 hydroxymethylglutaryl-CoA lyase [Pusillimonas noertemannii]TFL08764.1 hydroxymethylglutaryl-CoA lyase [Pusillimonas noertemannii]